VSFVLQPGQLTLVLGANGSGKSTLLKTLAKSMEPTIGEININGKSLKDIPLADFAKFRAVLTQQTNLSFQTKVDEVILMGRYPHFQQVPNPQDLQCVESAISLFDLNSFRHRMYDTLSGGEQQRVQFARVYAQIAHVKEGAILLLDEPLTFLDVKHQVEFILLIKELVSQKKLSCLMVIHDINLAVKNGDYFLFLKEGVLTHKGSTEVWNENLIKEVFGVDSKLIKTEGNFFFSY
jgi:iron complex transport system ATP-binding protein